MGPRLRARIAYRDRAPCRSIAEPQGQYGNLPVMEALGQMRGDISELGQRMRDGTGPLKVARRYAILQGRPQATRDACAYWFGVIVLQDAVHDALTRTNAVASVVDFELDDLSLVEGRAEMPDMILRGKSVETRVEREDGVLGMPLEPAPQAEDDVDVAMLQTAEAREGRSPISAVDRPPKTVPPADAAWPDAIDLGGAAAKRDLLGLRPGQSIAEASEVADALDGIEAVFVTTMPDRSSDPSQSALGYQKIYIRRGGREALTIASYAPDGEVVAIMRRMVVQGGTLPYDRIVAALEEKYGAPDRKALGGMLRGWAALLHAALRNAALGPDAADRRERRAADGRQGEPLDDRSAGDLRPADGQLRGMRRDHRLCGGEARAVGACGIQPRPDGFRKTQDGESGPVAGP